MGSPTVRASHNCAGGQEDALRQGSFHQVVPVQHSRRAWQELRACEWDGKDHRADLKRLQSICGYSTSSTCHEQSLDLLVNLQHCVNKQTTPLAGRILLRQIQPAREVAGFMGTHS